MQWDKVKTILLAILLVVDSFLAWNLSQNFIASCRRDHEVLANVRTLLNESGIQLAEEFSIPAGESLPALEAERSIHAEDAAAAALLGADVEREDLEDGSVRFANHSGESILFRRDGMIEARLEAGETPESSTDREHIAELLLAGFPTHGGVFQAAEDGSVHLTARIAGVELFDRSLEICFRNGWAVVRGRWTLELPYTTTGSNIYYDGADALLTYAYQAPENTVIRKMSLGYRLGEENAGRIPLVVCWRIQTDKDVEYLDTSKMTILTGEIS